MITNGSRLVELESKSAKIVVLHDEQIPEAVIDELNRRSVSVRVVEASLLERMGSLKEYALLVLFLPADATGNEAILGVVTEQLGPISHGVLAAQAKGPQIVALADWLPSSPPRAWAKVHAFAPIDLPAPAIALRLLSFVERAIRGLPLDNRTGPPRVVSDVPELSLDEQAQSVGTTPNVLVTEDVYVPATAEGDKSSSESGFHVGDPQNQLGEWLSQAAVNLEEVSQTPRVPGVHMSSREMETVRPGDVRPGEKAAAAESLETLAQTERPPQKSESSKKPKEGDTARPGAPLEAPSNNTRGEQASPFAPPVLIKEAPNSVTLPSELPNSAPISSAKLSPFSTNRPFEMGTQAPRSSEQGIVKTALARRSVTVALAALAFFALYRVATHDTPLGQEGVAVRGASPSSELPRCEEMSAASSPAALAELCAELRSDATVSTHLKLAEYYLEHGDQAAAAHHMAEARRAEGEQQRPLPHEY